MVVQTVMPVTDMAVVQAPQSGGDKSVADSEGIFSLLLLLSLMGKNGGQDPARVNLQGEGGGMRPENPGETSMSCRLTERHENAIPAQEGIQIGEGLKPSPTPQDRGLDSHLHGNNGHSGGIKGEVAVGLFSEQGKISLPGLHGLENHATPVVGDPGIAPPFLKESDYQNNTGANSDSQGEYPWMGGAGKISATADPVSSPADTRLHSFQMHIDQENIMAQLSGRMARIREIGTHSARIRLKPEELGELSLDISVTNNSVKALISVENYQVKEIIESNLNRLEAELKNQGLSMEQFTVETGGRGFREGEAPSYNRGDRDAQGVTGRNIMDRSVEEGHFTGTDFTGNGMVNIFV